MTAPEPPSSDRPYVDTPVTDLVAARRAADAGAMAFGLTSARLLRAGMNAVFACDTGVLRVSRPSAPAEASLSLAHRLRELGLDVPRPLSDSVHRHDGYSVTWWERVRASGRPIDWHRVGAMVAVLHGIERSDIPHTYPCPSPAAFPWWDFEEMLGHTEDLLDDRARAAIMGMVDRHRAWSTFHERQVVVCHGDVHPGNVIQAPAGPVLLDWDLLCAAPAGWDHGPMMRWADRWGGAAGEYEAFAEGYGRSFRGEAFAEAVADLRLVAATLMRVQRGRHDPAAASEAQRRLVWWRGEQDASPWRAQ